MRKPIIAGNWKMNNTIEESLSMVRELKDYELSDDVEKVLCVPYLSIAAVKNELDNTDIKIGAQNMHWEDSGAYTGEVSVTMLKELDIDYVILGHSERREYFNETDEAINKKIKAALKYKINPILCVGETLEERDSGTAQYTVKKQLESALKNISIEDMKNIVIAYEPIWAIGTGKTASAKDADQMLSHIRNLLKDKYGEVSDEIRLQYGGSVKPENIKSFMEMPNIDGALVGGASLKAKDFEKLINY